MRFFILFLCLYHCLLAQAKEGDDLKATSFAEKEVTDLMVIEGVNVITGSYSSSTIDAEISAPFGLFLQRHYAPWIPPTRSVPKGCWRDRFEWRCFSVDSSVCVLDGTDSLKQYDKAAKADSYHLFPGSKIGGRTCEFTISPIGRNPKLNPNEFAKKTDLLARAISPWVSEEGNINLMGKSILGKHFKEMWPPAILKKLKEIRQKYDPSAVFEQASNRNFKKHNKVNEEQMENWTTL